MDLIGEIKGLLTDVYEPGKKTLYVELHNRVFPFNVLDINCRHCGGAAYTYLNDYLKQNNMAVEKTETKKGTTYELVMPDKIATVKLWGGFMKLGTDATLGEGKGSPQELLEAAFKAGHTQYVKKVGE